MTPLEQALETIEQAAKELSDLLKNQRESEKHDSENN